MEKIKDKVRELTGFTVEKISRMEEDTNNNVFRVTAGNKDYIFKIYRSKDWPEDGKLLFINSKLQEYQIKSVKIIAFDRNDPDFSNGFCWKKWYQEELPASLPLMKKKKKSITGNWLFLYPRYIVYLFIISVILAKENLNTVVCFLFFSMNLIIDSGLC